MEISSIMLFVVSLVTILNPFGNMPIYLTVTAGATPKQQREIVFKMSIAILCILLLSIWVGASILNFFGISLGAFRIAGGLIIILIALKILGFLGEEKTKASRSVDVDSISVVPLAIPIIAGPGAIATTITHSRHYFPGMIDKSFASLICFIVVVLLCILYFFAPKISEKLGETKLNIMGKIMGLLLLGIGVEMLVEAVILIVKTNM